MIEIDSISKRYGQLQALADFSLSAQAGSRIGLLGPNGAGKSTAIKIIVGALAPDGGLVQLGGFDAFEYPFEVRRLIGWMPEAVPLYDEMEVRSYLTFCAGARGLRGGDVTSAVERVVALAQLESVAVRPVRELSRGFRQRVGLAQALVHDPSVLILDEPTSGLDPVQVDSLHRCLIGLCSDAGKTLILSTHILSDVESLAERVVMLRGGRTVFDGSIDEARLVEGQQRTLREAFLARMTDGEGGSA